MKNKIGFRSITGILIIIPLLVFGFKWSKNPSSFQKIYPRQAYLINYEFDLSNLPSKAFVKAYLPLSNEHQIVSGEKIIGDSLPFRKDVKDEGLLGKWSTSGEQEAVFQYQMEVRSKAMHFQLPDRMPFEKSFHEEVSKYLSPSKNIQSSHPVIDSIAQSLKRTGLRFTLEANFDYVSQITSSNTGVLTDALTTVKRNRASCNGKSRLFVALCRAQGIPAKLVGGLIMEETKKRTSHLWASVFYQDEWIPFDILNGHFAHLPANYLELYHGDHFLISRSKGIDFDYQFVIESNYSAEDNKLIAGFSLWNLINGLNLPLSALRGLLLLPIIGLILAIFRNVIGFKTFGIFLPALIGLALANNHLFWGLIVFAIVIATVALLHFPLQKMGLMHIPKVMVMMNLVIFTLLAIGVVSVYNEWTNLESSILIPIIILSITAERFAKTLVEENLKDASRLLLNTFLVAFICYPLFKANLLMGIFLTYPELYISTLGVTMVLGRWIGLRVSEYRRFAIFAQ